MDLLRKKILVAGLGKSGMAVIKALAPLNVRMEAYDGKDEKDLPEETLSRLKVWGISCHFAKEPEDLDSFDLLVVSPGIPLDIPLFDKARKLGLEIVGEAELAFRLGKGKYVGITGTNGKTTTTALTGKIFKQAGLKAEIVGNIGEPVIEKALNSSEDTWMITELSSFQLESMEKFHPKVSAILNLAADHLDRHGSFEEYVEAKKRIFKNQDQEDYFVYNADDEKCREIGEAVPAKAIAFTRKSIPEIGAFVQNDAIAVIDESGIKHEICPLANLKIKGMHNVENALAATAISYFSGVDISCIKAGLENFKGVAHRQEHLGEVEGITFVNDSKGTNPDSSIKALEAIEGPIILIAGGFDKSASFKNFVKAFKGRVKALVLIGETAKAIKDAAEEQGQKNIYLEKDMDFAVKRAFNLGAKGDTVLLSPACASWDMYENFEKRGDDFRSKVESLEKN